MKNTLYAHVHFTMILNNSLYLKIDYTQPELQFMSINDRFVYMLQNKQHLVAKICHQAFSKGRQNLSN